MKIRSTIIAAVCAATSLVAGCDDGASPAAPPPAPKPTAAKPGAVVPGATAAKPEIVTSVAYSYNPVSKRDPFRSPDEIIKPKAGGGFGSDVACREPLCAWDLDQLTLVAVVTGDSNPIGMLEDPTGKGYIIKRNSRVGKLGGKVTNILRDQITVTEYWTQPDGKSTPIQKPVRIKEDRASLPDLDLYTGQSVGRTND